MMSFLLALLKERQSKKRRLRPAPAGQCHGRRPAGEVPSLLTPPLQARLVTAGVIQPLLYLALRDPPRLDPARPAAAAAWPAAAGTGATPRRGFCSPGPLGGGAALVGRNGRPAPIPPGCNEDFTAKWIHCCRLCMVTKEYCQLWFCKTDYYGLLICFNDYYRLLHHFFCITSDNYRITSKLLQISTGLQHSSISFLPITTDYYWITVSLLLITSNYYAITW